jgi:hypothetical protein
MPTSKWPLIRREQMRHAMPERRSGKRLQPWCPPAPHGHHKGALRSRRVASGHTAVC